MQWHGQIDRAEGSVPSRGELPECRACAYSGLPPPVDQPSAAGVPLKSNVADAVVLDGSSNRHAHKRGNDLLLLDAPSRIGASRREAISLR